MSHTQIWKLLLRSGIDIAPKIQVSDQCFVVNYTISAAAGSSIDCSVSAAMLVECFPKWVDNLWMSRYFVFADPALGSWQYSSAPFADNLRFGWKTQCACGNHLFLVSGVFSLDETSKACAPVSSTENHFYRSCDRRVAKLRALLLERQLKSSYFKTLKMRNVSVLSFKIEQFYHQSVYQKNKSNCVFGFAAERTFVSLCSPRRKEVCFVFSSVLFHSNKLWSLSPLDKNSNSSILEYKVSFITMHFNNFPKVNTLNKLNKVNTKIKTEFAVQTVAHEKHLKKQCIAFHIYITLRGDIYWYFTNLHVEEILLETLYCKKISAKLN